MDTDILFNIDSGIFHSLLDLLHGIQNMSVTRVNFIKTHKDGKNDYWSYKIIVTKYPFSNKVEHDISLKDYKSNETFLLNKLISSYKEDPTYKELITAASNIIEKEEYEFL